MFNYDIITSNGFLIIMYIYIYIYFDEFHVFMLSNINIFKNVRKPIDSCEYYERKFIIMHFYYERSNIENQNQYNLRLN